MVDSENLKKEHYAVCPVYLPDKITISKKILIKHEWSPSTITFNRLIDFGLLHLQNLE